MREFNGRTSGADGRDDRRNVIVGALIGPVLFALALWFIFGPDPVALPQSDPVLVARERVLAEPLRSAIKGTPTIVAGGFDLRCTECHRLFPSNPDTTRTLAQHRHIVLDHGLNNRCLNCHDRENRNLLRLAGRETVTFGEAPRLCGSCHGLTYRDWQRGMHGRTNGYWDTTRGTQHRLICTECHDPHEPAFDPMEPLPGPRTLRMPPPSDRHEEAHSPGTPNPLRQWEQGGGVVSDDQSEGEDM